MEHLSWWLPNYPKTNMELILPELYATKSMTWSFHMGESQRNSRYDMIIGRELLLELKLDLCFFNYTIKGNGGVYEGCTAPMKYPSNMCHDAIYRNEEWWESKHLLDSTWSMCSILDAKYQKSSLSQMVSNSKYLNDNKQSMLSDVLTKYESLFNGTIETCKKKPVDIYLQRKAKPYHAKPYPVPQAHKAVFRN